MPRHHRLSQRAVIRLLASAIVQRHGLLGIDVRRPSAPPIFFRLARFTAGAAGSHAKASATAAAPAAWRC